MEKGIRDVQVAPLHIIFWNTNVRHRTPINGSVSRSTDDRSRSQSGAKISHMIWPIYPVKLDARLDSDWIGCTDHGGTFRPSMIYVADWKLEILSESTQTTHIANWFGGVQREISIVPQLRIGYLESQVEQRSLTRSLVA